MKKLLLLLLAFAIVGPAYAAKLEPETSVLITREENEAYNKLKNDDERKNSRRNSGINGILRQILPKMNTVTRSSKGSKTLPRR